MKKFVLIFLLCGVVYPQQFWKVVQNRLTPVSPAYGLDLRQGFYRSTGLRLGWSNQTDSGVVRYNAGYISYYNGSSWVTLGSGGGGSVGNADSLGGLPASSYLLVSDSSSKYVTKSTTQVLTGTKYWTNQQFFRDSVFISGKLIHGSSNYMASPYNGMISGEYDSIYSTASSAGGQNYVWGRNNTIGRTNPTGTYGNWMWGQYLRSEGAGNWFFGADDDFQKKIVPFSATIAFVNEKVIHWLSNPMPSLFDNVVSFSTQTPHVKDSIRFQWRLTKYGSASDALANAGFAFEGARGWTVDANGIMSNAGARIKRYFSVNDADDDAFHFNSLNTSGKPFGNVYVDSAHFIVSQGYLDVDSLKFNGTTIGTKLAWHSGLGASYWGAMTVSSLASQGAVSGTTGTFTGFGSFQRVLATDSIYTTSATSMIHPDGSATSPRLGLVKASGFGPEIRFLSSSASTFSIRRVTGGTILAPSASTVDMHIGATGNVTWSGGNHTGMGTISSGAITSSGTGQFTGLGLNIAPATKTTVRGKNANNDTTFVDLRNYNDTVVAYIDSSGMFRTPNIGIRSFTEKFDDFYTATATGDLNWTATNSTGSHAATSGDTTAWGVFQGTTGASATGSSYLSLGATSGSAGYGTAVFEARVKLNQLGTNGTGNAFKYCVGFGDVYTGAISTDGVWFQYDSISAGKWVCYTRKGGIMDTASVGSAISASTWYVLRAEIDGYKGSTLPSVRFYINGTLVRTVYSATAVPVGSALFGAMTGITKFTGSNTTAKTYNIDYFYISKRYGTYNQPAHYR